MTKHDPTSQGHENPSATGNERIGSYRWAICALLFFATTINYVDRSVLGLLAPVLQKEIGWEIDRGRKTAMLVCALLVVPIVFVPNVSLWWAVFLLGLATAAHQGWSANLFTTVSDMFPKRAVGSVTGIGGMAGSVGGILIASATGYILQVTGSYTILFVTAGSAYLLTLFIFHLLVPRIGSFDMRLK